ncbi:hypothetical protein C8J56DRAFT_315226 [Mycena floridula]|nr:hypothetical protein C8J56DRAFT_315226 [Mycena floridula]
MSFNLGKRDRSGYELDEFLSMDFDKTKSRRIDPERLATRLDPEMVREMEAYIAVPGASMPSWAIRKDLQDRYGVDRRPIYDYFHSRGLRVAKEDKNNNLRRSRLKAAQASSAENPQSKPQKQPKKLPPISKKPANPRNVLTSLAPNMASMKYSQYLTTSYAAKDRNQNLLEERQLVSESPSPHHMKLIPQRTPPSQRTPTPEILPDSPPHPRALDVDHILLLAGPSPIFPCTPVPLPPSPNNLDFIGSPLMFLDNEFHDELAENQIPTSFSPLVPLGMSQVDRTRLYNMFSGGPSQTAQLTASPAKSLDFLSYLIADSHSDEHLITNVTHPAEASASWLLPGYSESSIESQSNLASFHHPSLSGAAYPAVTRPEADLGLHFHYPDLRMYSHGSPSNHLDSSIFAFSPMSRSRYRTASAGGGL